jgi:hypothetical protein
MKKKVLVTAVLGVMTLGLLTGCGSQADVSSEDVVEVSEDTVIVQDAEVADEDTEATEEEVATEEDATEDEKLIKVTGYNEDGSLSYYDEYEYDETGAFSEKYYSADSTLMKVYEYDEAGNMVKYSDMELGTHAEWEYDEAGNPLVQKETNSYGYTGETYYTYEEYDALGKGIKWSYTFVDENGEIKSEGVGERNESADGTCEYDSAGRIIKRIYYDSDGNISSWLEYEYGSLD